MRFAQFYYVYGFWIIFMVMLFLLWAFGDRKRALRQFAEAELLPDISASVSLPKKKIKSALIITALIFGVLALMRPQWGFQWQEVKRRGLDILIAIDTSKSMLATDVKPDRLEKSKLAVKDLIKKLEGDRVGLIAFSGTAFLQCPLTTDYNGFLLALNDLGVNTIPRGGTSISSAIEVALESFKEGGESKYKVLVIITDGEDHEGDALKLADSAKKGGIKIFCIGIGTSEGELIQLADENGHRIFLKDREGNIVKTKLNETLLRGIALSTGGMYVRSSGAQFGLDFIYEEKLSQMEKRDIKTRQNKLYYDRFQIPLALVFIFLLIEPFISDRNTKYS